MALLVVGVLAAFAPDAGVTHPAERGPSDHVWILQKLQSERVIKRGLEIATLRFNPDHTVTGTWACNSVGPGKLTWTSIPGQTHGKLATGGASAGIITAVGCGNVRAMDLASRFWLQMETAHKWSIDHRGLSIRFADGSSARFL
ncbi:META domain-containing protein [Sphingomonas sp. UYP23]